MADGDGGDGKAQRLAEADELLVTLRKNRLISIYIGQDDDVLPLLVPHNILCSASEYFVKAFKNEHMGGGETGVLRFPEDEEATWSILLYWIFKSDLPYTLDDDSWEPDLNSKTQLCLVKCWILGDKLDIPDFQNAVMLELLHRVASCRLAFEALKEALVSSVPESALSKLAMAELVFKIVNPESYPKFTAVERDSLDGIPGITALLVAAIQKKPAEKLGMPYDYIVSRRKSTLKLRRSFEVDRRQHALKKN